jgi:hypothetical protein
MFPWLSLSTCSAASPCTRLSRAPSTTSGSDFHHDIGLLVDGPFGWPTRPISGQDRGGSPRFRDTSFSVRAVLSDPAGVSGSLASDGNLRCLPSFRPCRPPDYRVTRLNRFTCVTAWTWLGLRLTHVVASMSPRLDSWWGGSFPLPGREFHPLEAPGLSWRTEIGPEIQIDDSC